MCWQATHGRGRFYSSVAQRPINSVSLMAVSFIGSPRRFADLTYFVSQISGHLPAAQPVKPRSQLAKRNCMLCTTDTSSWIAISNGVI
jgi:hypothetical protein